MSDTYKFKCLSCDKIFAIDKSKNCKSKEIETSRLTKIECPHQYDEDDDSDDDAYDQCNEETCYTRIFTFIQCQSKVCEKCDYWPNCKQRIKYFQSELNDLGEKINNLRHEYSNVKKELYQKHFIDLDKIKPLK